MSGPKISVYSLSGWARKNVMAQMQCDTKCLAAAAAAFNALAELKILVQSLDKTIQNCRMLEERIPNGAVQIQETQDLQAKIKNEILSFEKDLAGNKPTISEKYTVSEERLLLKQAQLEAFTAIRQRIEALKAKAIEKDNSSKTAIRDSILEDLNWQGESDHTQNNTRYVERYQSHDPDKIQKSILDDLNGVYSFETVEESVDSVLVSEKHRIHKQLMSLLENDSLPKEITNEIKQAVVTLQKINDINFMQSFEAITISKIIKRIEDFNHIHKDYIELIERYRALCSLTGEEAKEIPCSKDGLSFILAENERLELAAVKQREQEYIRDCVDEVMSDMGYELIGEREVKKKSGKRFRNELYTFNEGTAINITFSSDGQISMELGGLSKEDRIPSAEEAEMLTEDMESFCGEFAEFEKRLLAKGVVIGKRISILPPKTDYAAIINLTDYDIDSTVQLSVIESKRKRHTRTEKKTIRRNE